MSVNCDKCGYRDNEVKSGAAISPQGRKITLKVEDREDLSRDILKVTNTNTHRSNYELIMTIRVNHAVFKSLKSTSYCNLVPWVVVSQHSRVSSIRFTKSSL